MKTGPSKEIKNLYKLLVVGDSKTGKTQLVSRFCHNEFPDCSAPTLIMDTSTKLLENREICAQIWDMSGNDIFKTVTSCYYENAVGAIVLYDVASVRSFQNAGKWIDYIREKTNGSCLVILLVGNKSDLRRCVAREDGNKLAKSKNVLFEETSALDGTNANKAFLRLIDHVTNRMGQRELKSICSAENRMPKVSPDHEANAKQDSIRAVSSQPKAKLNNDKIVAKSVAVGQAFFGSCQCFWSEQ